MSRRAADWAVRYHLNVSRSGFFVTESLTVWAVSLFSRTRMLLSSVFLTTIGSCLPFCERADTISLFDLRLCFMTMALSG